MCQQLTKYTHSLYDQTIDGVVSDGYCFRGSVSALVELSKKLVSIGEKIYLNVFDLSLDID